MKKKNTEIKKLRRGFGALCMAVMVFFSSSGLHVQAVSWETSVFIDINQNTTNDDADSYKGKKIEKGTAITFRQTAAATATDPVRFLYDVKGTVKEKTDSAWDAANETFSYTPDSADADLAGYNDQEILGWKISGVSTGTPTAGTPGRLYSVALQPVFKEYAITYELDGGTNAAGNPVGYTYGTGAASLSEATKEGYTFAGWYTDAALSTETHWKAEDTTPVIGGMESGAKTFYAKYTPNTYGITYELNGGTNAAGNPVEYAYGTGAASLSEATKEGYTFAGWYTDAALSTEAHWKAEDATPMIGGTETGAKTFYAKYTPNTYEITYDRDGGYTSSMTVNVSNDAAVYLSEEYSSIKSILVDASVKNVSYRIVGSTSVDTGEQKEILSDIKGTDKKFSFVFADGDKTVKYSWTFAGADIADPSIAVDFGMDTATSGTEALGKVDEDVTDATNVHFSHNGALPGKATVEFPVNTGLYPEGSTVNLYYYNPEAGAFEEVASSLTITNGNVALPILHCSDYILTAKSLKNLVSAASSEPEEAEEAEADNSEAEEPAVIKAPKTGEENMTWLLCGLLFLSGISAVLAVKKVRNE